MKELVLWIGVLLAVALGIYAIDSYNDGKNAKATNTKKQENTDCLIIPSHPSCSKGK